MSFYSFYSELLLTRVLIKSSALRREQRSIWDTYLEANDEGLKALQPVNRRSRYYETPSLVCLCSDLCPLSNADFCLSEYQGCPSASACFPAVMDAHTHTHHPLPQAMSNLSDPQTTHLLTNVDMINRRSQMWKLNKMECLEHSCDLMREVRAELSLIALMAMPLRGERGRRERTQTTLHTLRYTFLFPYFRNKCLGLF